MKTKLMTETSEVSNVWSKKLIKEFIDTTKKDKYPKKAPPTIKMMVDHFKKDKWPLGLNHIISDISYEVLGFSVLEYCLSELYKNGIDLSVGERDNDLVLYLEEKKPSNRKSKK